LLTNTNLIHEGVNPTTLCTLVSGAFGLLIVDCRLMIKTFLQSTLITHQSLDTRQWYLNLSPRVVVVNLLNSYRFFGTKIVGQGGLRSEHECLPHNLHIEIYQCVIIFISRQTQLLQEFPLCLRSKPVLTSANREHL